MNGLEAEILAASRGLRIPGGPERRVLSRESLARLAEEADEPLWRIEAQALQADVVPLHYLRNLARFSAQGQAALLTSRVALAGRDAVLGQAAEIMAMTGIGRLRLLLPEEGVNTSGAIDAVRNRNPSCAVEVHPTSIRRGDPAGAVRDMDAVAACLDDSAEEQLLQFACRMAKTPLVLGGVEGMRAQLTTVFPGDPGVALVYKPSHPHLEPCRRDAGAAREIVLMVGSRLAEQVTHLLLGTGTVLRRRLLFADLQAGELAEYEL